MLDFNGPCLTGGDNVRCRFGDGENALTGSAVIVNSMRGRCMVPNLLQRGRVKVSVAVNNLNTYYFDTVVTIGK